MNNHDIGKQHRYSFECVAELQTIYEVLRQEQTQLTMIEPQHIFVTCTGNNSLVNKDFELTSEK